MNKDDLLSFESPQPPVNRSFELDSPSPPFPPPSGMVRQESDDSVLSSQSIGQETPPIYLEDCIQHASPLYLKDFIASSPLREEASREEGLRFVHNRQRQGFRPRQPTFIRPTTTTPSCLGPPQRQLDIKGLIEKLTILEKKMETIESKIITLDLEKKGKMVEFLESKIINLEFELYQLKNN